MVGRLLNIIRQLLQEAIDKIDAGNSNHTEEELMIIIDELTKMNRGIKRISKDMLVIKFFIVVLVLLIIILK